MKKPYSCANCNATVYRTASQLKTKSGNVFCSSSCAASYNNHKFPKRTCSHKCKSCSTTISSGYTYCTICYVKKHYLTEKTLEQAINNRKNDTNRYSGIRGNARNIFLASEQSKVCRSCGYGKHIEICHIKDIADFPLTSLISEVNHISNLVALCPNCHWEFDHGLIGPEGLEPPIASIMSRVL